MTLAQSIKNVNWTKVCNSFNQMAYIAKFFNQTYDNLALDKWVCKNVDFSIRTQKIPFRHYQENVSPATPNRTFLILEAGVNI